MKCARTSPAAESLAESHRALRSQLWNVKIEVEMQDDA